MWVQRISGLDFLSEELHVRNVHVFMLAFTFFPQTTIIVIEIWKYSRILVYYGMLRRLSKEGSSIVITEVLDKQLRIKVSNNRLQ